jgi:phage terminase small subunit
MANGLTDKQLAFVAAYIGRARQNATEAARIAGYSPKTAYSIANENLNKPEIAEAIQKWRDSVKQQGIASLEYRITQLDLLEQKYFDLIEARSDEHADVPGGATGLLVRQIKLSPNGIEVEEYVADTAVTKEIRAIYDDAAKEMGHRATKSETRLSDANGEPFKLVIDRVTT